MTIDDIKAAVDAGKSVHWANEGYVVHKDSAGHYLITFTPNGSTIGLTDRACTKLNGQSELFFVARPDLGRTMRCSMCHSQAVQHKCWAAWDVELQTWAVEQFDDDVFCNGCHSVTDLILITIRDYGSLCRGEPVHNTRASAVVVGQGEKGESRLSEGGPQGGWKSKRGCAGKMSGNAKTQGEDPCSQEP